ncbi:multidrug efflux MFS transporter [Clostridium beijerinckii]|uniref:MFS family permease n=1 Tax=Clostridium beijerinckii TaxID=1520 RepID=A0AAX0AUF7_CLOBE|nr:multidrug efflux MFS transporter [Clostridium beijerinckii]NRT86608.1 MFS family permease [Clostridium beijerinckii]NYC72041.1 MFS family permease [Clostridium beijerinckii]
MEMWKRNLKVCWFGMFVTGIGMSQIAPVLPLYIQHLGIQDAASVEKLSGIAFGSTFIISAIFSPIWGHAADKFGRKPMLLRASLGMAIVISCMGFAPNVYVLIALRLLQGAITGYSTACTTLIATQTDKEHAGYALGTISTANIAGSLLGPTIGGFVGETFGLQNVFFITGGLMFIAFITTVLFVKESFSREDNKVLSFKEVWNTVPEKGLTITLFITFFILSVAMYSVEPIVTVYVTQLSKEASHIALIAGIIFIPQAFVTNTWELMGLRFLLGLTAGGLNPSVNILVKKITPSSLTGRVFGFSMAAGYLGVFAGSVLGGQIAGYLGIKCVFFVTSALLLINAVLVYFKVYNKLNINNNHRIEKYEKGIGNGKLQVSGK